MVEAFQLQMNEYLPLRDVVFQTLRQAILRGELKPGERLMEIHLAQKLGVSRTPVREAIRKLELEGLVLMIPRKGAVVAEITVSDLEDVLEVRSALEELAVKCACRKITSEQISHSLKGDDISACAQADETFHGVIYQATGNRRLVQMLSNLREQMYRYRVEYLKDRQSHQILLQEHREIMRALERKDEEAAARITAIHIERQKENIINSLTKKE